MKTKPIIAICLTLITALLMGCGKSYKEQNAERHAAAAKANADEKVRSAIEGKTVVKEIYVKGKLVNIVVK